MNIAVVGIGYMGAATLTALGLKGFAVTGIDRARHKLELLREGKLPFYEPELESALRQLLARGDVRFHDSLLDGVGPADVILLCVGTPSSSDGQADLTQLDEVLEQLRALAAHSDKPRVIVIKSTVPPGTTEREAIRFAAYPHISLAVNPEFLREGSALADALKPDRIVIGSDSARAIQVLQELFRPFDAPFVITRPRNAEMIKYAANAFLATRISFMNELARYCHEIGADVSEVAAGMGLDVRIGPHFLQAGVGFGGSCFPKDTAAILWAAQQADVELAIIKQVREVNESQPHWFFRLVEERLQGVGGRQIALLGLSFKPGTDDIREAPSLTIISKLLEAGARLCAYDPAAMDAVRRLFPSLPLAADPYEALADAEAAILLTEWPEVTDLDWVRVREVMARPVLFDGRNAWPKQQLLALGFAYTGVGR
ncbi:MAG: UDP-glucose/GDP-mannose dehydrogenase family protein [Brevibacillus sp.]|nr:UDP-glucose/GDP-mannose dehydrogenase family protein [Brevibacillus sp.]